MSKKEQFYENDGSIPSIEDSPIFIPNESYIEGYLKSSKSIKLECNLQEQFLLQKNC